MSNAFPHAGLRYREFLTGVFESRVAIREGAPGLPIPDPTPIPEMELQARWFAGEFGRDFTCTSGETIRIVQFGHWNRSAGPDFTEASIDIGGKKLSGAIEIDLDVTGWETHGHGANPAFDEVVLQVFLHEPTGSGRYYTRNSRHQEVAQVRLDPAAVTRTGTWWSHVPEARLGRCAAPLAEMPAERVESLLAAAAQFRLIRKAARLAAIAEAHSDNQALFQAIAEALGYRHNKIVMAILAQRLPMKDLRLLESPEREALLFGVAGFIGHEQFESADPATRPYLKALWDHWWKRRDEFEPEPEKQLPWRLSGVRPANHPQRRVGALAALADRWKTFRSVAKSTADDWPKRAREFLGDLAHDYWRHHYTLRSKASEKPMALIGENRIRDILGNILFPLALHERPAEWPRFCKFPGSLSNENLRRATLRLFGQNRTDTGEFSKKYYQQQALLQIYRDFCLEDTTECAECPFPEQLRQWK